MAPTTAATTAGTQGTLLVTTKPPKPRLACFSFAAYAKSLIETLKESCNVPVSPGLTDHEISSIESTFHFTFPPDLRAILQVGLPMGPHWPNWRSSSLQQLRLLLKLPALCLSRNVSQHNFWSDSWGPKPSNNNSVDDASCLFKQLLDKAPVLVPIYRDCYIPSTPNLAGNPVFYVDEREVCVLSFDVSGFFQEIERFLQMGVFLKPLLKKFKRENGGGGNHRLNSPAWAATAARGIEFWTDAAERGHRVVARGSTQGWWSGRGMLGLECCLEEVFWRLRDGGWREEEVREMLMMMVIDRRMDGCDVVVENGFGGGAQMIRDREELAWHVKVLSLELLRAGWSTEDVVDSLGLEQDDCSDLIEVKPSVGSQRRPAVCSVEEDDHHHRQKSTINQLMEV